MKKVVFAALFSIITFAGFSQQKVLMILREGRFNGLDDNLQSEVLVIQNKLQENGYQVVITSESGNSLVGEKVTVKPDVLLNTIIINDYSGIVIPCLSLEGRAVLGTNIVGIVKTAYGNGIPIAAQHNGVYILHAAGLLSGKKFAMHANRLADGIYSGTGVIRDGLIITSGTCTYVANDTKRPDGSIELANQLIEAIQGK